MEISNILLSTLRDRINSNTQSLRKHSKLLEIQILFEEFKLGLITKEELLNNPIYIQYKKEQIKNIKEINKTEDIKIKKL